MRILAWNILHGGGASRTPHITLALLAHDADAIVLTEFRTTMGGQIRAILADHGWPHQRCTDPGKGQNGVLLASRLPLADPETPKNSTFSSGVCARRWIEAFVPDLGLSIAGVHVPCEGRDGDRIRFLKGLLEVARTRADTPFAIVGDLNLGRHHLDERGSTFTSTPALGKLATLGYIDVWRHHRPAGREYSWYSAAGSGFRIDHAFVSRALAGAVRGAWYSHEERDAGISDHSALIVELDIARVDAPHERRNACPKGVSTEESRGFWDHPT